MNTTTIDRRGFLKVLGLGAAGLALPHALGGRDVVAATAAPAPAAGGNAGLPNIIFILADDLGYGDPHCYNPDSKAPTPHMDAMAARGVRFTDAHSGSSVCTPTRYGVLTGRYSWRTGLKRGVLGGFSPPLIEPGRMTVASLLRERGYATACIGKWHLGMGWPGSDGKAENPDAKGPNAKMEKHRDAGIDFSKPIAGGPTTNGFDYYFGISASLDMPPYVYIENDRTVVLPTDTQEKWGVVRPGPKAPGFKFEDVLPTLTRKAVERIAGCARTPEKPFFIYLPLTAPHTPVVPSDRVKGASKAGPYGDFVAETDWAVGEVMKALAAAGVAENTLVIFTSDNGSTNPPMKEFDHLPNGRLRGRKSTIWDGGHREPFLAVWPARIKPGQTSAETVWLGDLLATCAAISGADLPDDAGEDSFNILPALVGEKVARPIHEAVVHHSIDGMFAIRSGRWKLVLGRGSGGWDGKGQPADPPGQLYDMEKDASEAENLYGKHPEVVERLTSLLEKYKADGRSRPRRG